MLAWRECESRDGVIEEKIDAVFLELDGVGLSSETFSGPEFLTPISKPPGARCSARNVPVPMTLDSG